MTTTTGDPFRNDRLRRAGVWVKAPRVVLASLLWLVLIEALPSVAGWAVLAVVVGGTVAGVVAEPAMVAVLWWARRPTTLLMVPGDRQVQVLVTARRGAAIGIAGRRHLIVPAAWVGRPDLPTRLAQARLRQLVSAGRFDVAYEWFTWPWQLLGAFVAGAAHGASGLPLIGLAWRVRLVVAGVAVWQSVVAGRWAATVGIVVVIGLTYLLPWTTTHRDLLLHDTLADLTRPPTEVQSRRPAARFTPTLARCGRRGLAGPVRVVHRPGRFRRRSAPAGHL